ncbi:MAG: ABC transporter ATP-binding protein [Actinomycetota bacterium]|nr:ABC transporter ATP-binding protein [Actinomycetota bacterium]
MAVAVEVDGVSKNFRLYHEKYNSLKERMIHWGRTPHDDFWALRPMSFEVEEGETLGILGRNGSGKSTLLKCIGGILRPSSGEVRVRGKLAAMLELGAGFQPELSGRDNIYLNGSLLGLSKREIARRFDEIVAFSELEQFIDNQVKFYSSGMYVRLGFSIAVTMEPDVLLVDEVLAVGDERFQTKCLERIRRLQNGGCTILFVTHAADTIRRNCDRAIVLEQGQMLFDGTAGEAIRALREQFIDTAAGDGEGDGSQAFADLPTGPDGAPGGADGLIGAGAADGSQVVATAASGGPDGVAGEVVDRDRAGRPRLGGRMAAITGVSMDYPGAPERPYLLPGDPLTITVGYEVRQPIDSAVFGIAIHNPRGDLVFASDTEILGQDTVVPVGKGEVVFRFDSIPLLDGTYSVAIGIRNQRYDLLHDWRENKDRFEVMNPGKSIGEVALPVKAEIRPGS